MKLLYDRVFNNIKTILKRVEALPETTALKYSVVITLILAVIDHFTSSDFAFTIFYLIPVSFAAWFAGRNNALRISLLCIISSFFTHSFIPNPDLHFLVRYWNAVTEMFFYSITSIILSELKTTIINERELARTDYLTGLNNLRYFFELSNNEINRAHRQNYFLTIAYMDLDNFKTINDTYGHTEGDLLLKTASDIIKRSTRQTDIVARLGGDEFAVLMSDAGYEEARKVLERIRQDISDTFKSKNWNATISIGAATCMGQQCSVDALLKSADTLMYEAKENGKNRLIHKPIETIPACRFEKSVTAKKP